MQAAPSGTTTVQLFSWAQLGAVLVTLLVVGLVVAAVILLLVARHRRHE